MTDNKRERNDIVGQIARELDLTLNRVAGTVRLLEDGNTIPFIARYRKEVTGGLDETQIRDVESRLTYLQNLADRKQTVLKSIEEQGKLTNALAASIHAATTLQEVEDLYLPYKPKRRTRATIAREQGLEPLADILLAQPTNTIPQEAATDFLTDGVPDVEAALAGARDIVAEQMAETAEIRQKARAIVHQAGHLVVELSAPDADPDGKYHLYHSFRARVSSLQPHQILAINRGEEEGALRVSFEVPEQQLLEWIEEAMAVVPDSPFAEEVRAAIADGYRRLLMPSIERGMRATLTDDADDHAIETFQENLRNLLMQPPLKSRTVIGIDPAYRTGCKVAVSDPTGKVMETTTLYPHAPQKEWAAAKAKLTALIKRYEVRAIAIGNGTASRETEQLVAEVLDEIPDDTAYALVNEAGASVYSASPLARRELPDLDVAMRGAVSIARRLQDPLAELVKIDPKSIGVGLYQHDVDQKKLAEALDVVVESVVNAVGVNVNTASPALLQHVAGLNRRVADRIVAYRDEHGPYRSRKELLQVRGLGEKTYQQAAGFLRIPDGDNPLDDTAIHPESYPIVQTLLERYDAGSAGNDDTPFRERLPLEELKHTVSETAKTLDVGVPTLRDILAALEKPGRDPRDDLPQPILRHNVLTMDDLEEGMLLKGTVRNVVDFGAFVDIGVKRDGLIHISELADRYVRNPHEVVRVGDVVTVRVLSVDRERERIGLSARAV